MYYKDVELFRSQPTVDRVRLLDFTEIREDNLFLHFSKLVDDLAATLQLSRSDLSVVCPRSLPHTLRPLNVKCNSGHPPRDSCAGQGSEYIFTVARLWS